MERLFGYVGIVLVLALIGGGVYVYVTGGKDTQVVQSYPSGDSQKDQSIDKSISSIMILSASFRKAGSNIVDRQDANGLTPLHWAAFQGHSNMLRLLINEGANINAKATNGMTPLHYAAMNGQTAIVKILLKNHVETDSADGSGNTPYKLAKQYNHTDITSLLSDTGAEE